ncbi:MAG TPA: hypothetical protein VIW48_02470 [Nitrospiraceae bacterium]
MKATIREENIIEINTHYVRRLTRYLNDQIVNLAHPITIVTNGRITYEGIIQPTVRTLFLADCGKTMPDHRTSSGPHVWGNRTRLRRIAERDWRDGRDEVGVQSVHGAPFSHVSRFTRHGLWRWRTVSASC